MHSGVTWVTQWVKCLPLAQVMILGSWDGNPSLGSLLSRELASPSSGPPTGALFPPSNKIFWGAPGWLSG